MIRFAAVALALAADTPLTDAAGNPPVEAPETPVTIPFELQDNLIRLPVTLNGARRSAVLDSGTGTMLVNREVAAAIGLNEIKSDVQAAGAGAEAPELRSVQLADLAVGPLRFARLTGFTADLHHLTASAGFPIDLLLGGAAFTAGAVTIDYPRRTVTVGKTGSAGRCAAPIPITILHGVPIVEAELAATPTAAPAKLKLLVDLGTRHHAVMLRGAVLQSAGGKALLASGTKRQVGTGIGGKVEGVVAQGHQLRIARSRFDRPMLALDPSTTPLAGGLLDGTLGVPLWKAGRITLDYPAGTLCIDTPRA